MNRSLARAAAIPTLVLAALALAGCANSSDYPSLARRPIEGSISGDPAICAAKGDIVLPGDEPGRVAGSAEPAPPFLAIPPAAEPPSRETSTRLAQLIAQARAADGRFNDHRGEAERVIGAATGSSPGTEAWSTASVALSGLESARSDALVALSELDQRYADAAVLAAGRSDTSEADAISAARDQVDALVTKQDAVLLRLRRRLR